MFMRKSIIFFYYLFLFILTRTRKFFIDLDNHKVSINKYGVFGLIKFYFDRDFNPSKSKPFQEFTRKNKAIWKKNKIKQGKKKYILTSFVHIPEDQICNSLVSKYIERTFKAKSIIPLINKKDIQSEIIMRSYGFKSFKYLKEPNIFNHLIIFIKSYLLLSNNKSPEDFLKLKFRNIFYGKIVSEHVIRHTGYPQINNINFSVIYNFSIALDIDNQFSSILKKDEYNGIIMSENQFLPCGIIYQRSLNKKLNVYARHGHPKISIINFRKFNEVYTARAQISKKLFKSIVKKDFNYAVKEGKKIFYEKINKGIDNVWKRESRFVYKNLKYKLHKKAICKILNWDKKKKILVIFTHTFLDGNYVQGWRAFKDNFEWLKETLDFASKNPQYNYLIKTHPMDSFYKKVKVNTKDFVEEYCKKFNHIKLCPEKISPKSCFELTDVGVTSHGTVSLELNALGKPCISAGRTSWGEIVQNLKPINKNEYFKKLKNADKIEKPSKLIRNKMYIYFFIQQSLMTLKHPLVVEFPVSRYSNRDVFWLKNIKSIKNYKYENDFFNKCFKYQVKNNLRHTINLQYEKKLDSL